MVEWCNDRIRGQDSGVRGQDVIVIVDVLVLVHVLVPVGGPLRATMKIRSWERRRPARRICTRLGARETRALPGPLCGEFL